MTLLITITVDYTDEDNDDGDDGDEDDGKDGADVGSDGVDRDDDRMVLMCDDVGDADGNDG